MPVVHTAALLTGDPQGMVSVVIVFLAVLMSVSIASAALFHTYRGRFSMPGVDAGSARDISEAPVDAGGRATPDSARAVLEVRTSTLDREYFGGRKAATEGDGETETERHPLRTVSDVEGWKFAVSFVATVILGGVAYGVGDISGGSELVLALALLAVFFFGAVLLSGGFTSFRMYHIVRATPTTDASDVSRGETVEMYGKATVSDHGTHDAPFTDDECLVCEYEIIEKPGEDEVVDSGTAGVPFYLEDSTGRVLVDPEEANLRMALDTEVEVDSQEPPDEIRSGYVDVGVNEVRSEYRERYLEPGEDVYVYGDAVTSEGGDVVVNRRNEDSVFLIADSSEGELRKSLLSKAVAYGTVGVVLMSVGMGVLSWVSGLSVYL